MNIILHNCNNCARLSSNGCDVYTGEPFSSDMLCFEPKDTMGLREFIADNKRLHRRGY